MRDELRKMSTPLLKERLGALGEDARAAEERERAAEARHAREGAPETEAALEGRREEAGRLEVKRRRLAGELRRRAVAMKGWALEEGIAEGSDESPPPVAGVAGGGRLRVGPHPLLPERGYLLHDRASGEVAWVREVPTPDRAAELLAEHGVAWEGELVSHRLSPVPEEEERRPGRG